MSRPKIYDDSHFAFTRRLNPNGTIYIIAYRNQWDPIKKRSRVKERHTVGVLNQETGRVLLGKTYLKNHPEMEGKVYFYEDNKLVEAQPQLEPISVSNANPETEMLDDIISWGASFACLHSLKELKIQEALSEVFGAEDAVRLMQLAIYQYLTKGSCCNFEQWAPGVWMPACKGLSSQRISELLSKVTQEKVTRYFKLRFDLASGNSSEEDLRFLALDSTAISSYSETIEDAAYGHAKQNPELKQINYTLGVDYMSGDILYGYESEGSVGDKSLYPQLLIDMRNHGFPLEKTVLVTDRGYESLYNIQRLLNENAKYVCGVPLSEKSVRDKLDKYWQSFNSSAFYSSDYEVYARSDKEMWEVRQSHTGQSQTHAYWIHFYRDPQLSQRQSAELLAKVDQVLKIKSEGKEAEAQDWKKVRRFVQKDEKYGWVKNVRELDSALRLTGCFAIRTNCIEDPFKALEVYRERNIVETNFRLFKVSHDGRRLYCGNRSYVGKLFVHTLAANLRFYQLKTMKKNAEKQGVKLATMSMETAIMVLDRLKAVKARRSEAWKVKVVSKKARDILALLNVKKLPDYLH